MYEANGVLLPKETAEPERPAADGAGNQASDGQAAAALKPEAETVNSATETADASETSGSSETAKAGTSSEVPAQPAAAEEETNSPS